MIAHTLTKTEPCPLPANFLYLLARLWTAFCIVKIAGAALIYFLDGGRTLWKPLLWESSSLITVTLLAMAQLRIQSLWHTLLNQPRRWVLSCLAYLPLWCLVFLTTTFGLRYAVYAFAGETYDPGPWPRVAVYESITLAIFYVLWLGIIFGLAAREHLLAEKRRALDITAALRDAQLALLRQQLQPHFLFNALNLISATMYEDVARADTLLRKLAGLLRQAAAQTDQALHPIGEELALLRDYADIMSARFEGRVNIDWQIGPLPSALRVPSMIAQPLLENAFKYGVEPYANGCHIVIAITIVEGALTLRICQNRGTYVGDGVPAAKLRGQGIANVRQRLAAHYGARATFIISPQEPEGVCVQLTLPCEY